MYLGCLKILSENLDNTISIFPHHFLPLASLIDGIKLGSQSHTYFSLKASLCYQNLSTCVSSPLGKLETLRNINRREVYKLSCTDAVPPVNLSLTRIKYSRGRRKARPAAQIMTACSQAKLF